MIENDRPSIVMVGPFEGAAEVFLTALDAQLFDQIQFVSGGEALSFLAAHTAKLPCLVVLDLLVSDMDGFEFLEVLRSVSPLSDVVVMAPSTLAFARLTGGDWVIEAMRLGAYRLELVSMAVGQFVALIDTIVQEFNLAVKKETSERTRWIKELPLRLEILSDLIQKRHMNGGALSKDELLSFLPVIDDHNRSIIEDFETHKIHLGSLSQVVPKILVVEDEDTIRKTLCNILMRQKYHVQVATTVAEAKQHLNAGPYDLVMLDIGLPDGSGETLIQDVKVKSPDTDVVMLTAYRDFDVIISSFRKGASDYIVKPFVLDNLIAMVAQAIQRRMLRYFLPHRGVLPSAPFGDHLTVQFQLFDELIDFRSKIDKPILLDELIILFPSLGIVRPIIPKEFVAMDLIHGVKALLTELVDTYELDLTEVERDYLTSN